jgi:PmbA protein
MKSSSQTQTSPLVYSSEALRSLSLKILQMAKALGATDASAEVSESSGLSVTVRKQDIETLESTRDRAASVTVYSGLKRGHATTSDFSDQALKDAVAKALDIAKYTAEDPCAGLPEDHLIAKKLPRLNLYFPWEISAQEAVKLVLAAEQAALKTSPAIRNSEGASLSASHGQFFSANTRGFEGGYPYSRHWISVAPIAQSGESMQRDDWYTSDRDPTKLSDPQRVGRYAAQRALARLNARKLKTQKVPVLFEAPLASGLLGAFVQAVSGSALYRKSSFLLDSLGQPVFPKHIQIEEDPLIDGAMGSAPFDDEGVRVRARDVVRDGVVKGYFLSCYTARKLGMESTGNAGGSHNLVMRSTLTQPGDDLMAMVRKMHRGLLLTEVMGQGVNYVTGDYSRGAFGYWVENGEIAYPVEEITIAANMKDMFAGIVGIGADTLCRGTKTIGSVLVNEMTIAGD